MKIVILTGSPHPKGTTSVLAQNYKEGALQTGHEVLQFDTARLDIKPCLGCDYCYKHGGQCVHKDDMAEINEAVTAADKVVLVTPLYYYGMTAQLKACIDRFYAANDALMADPKSFELLAACTDIDESAMDALVSHFTAIGGYLGWYMLEPLLALGCSTKEDIEKTVFPAEAKKRGAQQ